MSFSSGFPSLTLKHGPWTEDQGQTDGASRSLGSLACWMSKETPEARRRVGGRGIHCFVVPFDPRATRRGRSKSEGAGTSNAKGGGSSLRLAVILGAFLLFFPRSRPKCSQGT